MIQAASGLSALQASIVGEPRYMPTIVADKTSSLTVLSSVLAALFHRERTGEGQSVEIPMMESVVAYVMVEHLYGETFIPPLESAGYKRILARWRRPFQTKDGYLAVVPYTDAHWRTFFEIAGRPDMLGDPRFKSLESRLANIEILYEELGKIVATRNSAEWLEALERANVPATIVNTLESLLTDPQLEATGFWKIVEHPTEGTLRMPDIPATYSKTPGDIRRLQPRLGEHSVEVLREAGFTRRKWRPCWPRAPPPRRRDGRGALTISRDIVGPARAPSLTRSTRAGSWPMPPALGETEARYYDTLAADGPAAHPLFPVCYEWPALLALRAVTTSDEMATRSVHATHDLVIHRPLRAGETLRTTARRDRPRAPARRHAPHRPQRDRRRARPARHHHGLRQRLSRHRIRGSGRGRKSTGEPSTCPQAPPACP